MAQLGPFPVELGTVFPSGAYAAGGFEMVRDFERSKGDLVIQQADKATGLPLWVIEVIDADPEARQRTVKVKVAATYQPVLPDAPAPGSPFVPVEFEGLQATSWVDASRCRAKETGKCGARMAYSLKATGSGPVPAAVPPGARAQGRGLMPARRVPALALPVDPQAAVCFRGYEHRTPLLTITTGRPALLVTLTLPEQLEAGHVDFARQLAAQAWAYAAAVERRYRACRRCPTRRSRPRCGPARTPGPAIPAARPWRRCPGGRR